MDSFDKAIKEVRELREHDEEMARKQEAIDHERWEKIKGIASFSPASIILLLDILEHRRAIAMLILKHPIGRGMSGEEATQALEYDSDVIKKALYL